MYTVSSIGTVSLSYRTRLLVNWSISALQLFCAMMKLVFSSTPYWLIYHSSIRVMDQVKLIKWDYAIPGPWGTTIKWLFQHKIWLGTSTLYKIELKNETHSRNSGEDTYEVSMLT
uniref:Uncharacterized protein n=1 Tax=Kalanchoe fedtschenkoi TaxID=63787 RepID=A0A7N0U4J1_KALFE